MTSLLVRRGKHASPFNPIFNFAHVFAETIMR